MSSATRPIRLDFEDAYYRSSADTPADPRYGEAETHSARALLSRLGAFVAPVAIAAVIFAPAGPPVTRRIYSRGSGSRTHVLGGAWDFDDGLAFHSAWTAQAEIDELNRLFAMSPTEGSWFEFPDA